MAQQVPDAVKQSAMRQVLNLEAAASPSGRRKQELAQRGNGLIAQRQREVLPSDAFCGMWSFAVPWAPFQHYIDSGEPDAKPFLWSDSFRLGTAKFSVFWGMERLDAEGGRVCLWMGVGNSTFNPITVYTKTEIWMPGSMDVSPCGDVFFVGDAVDTLSPCGSGQHARFWWHLRPQDVSPNLFRATFDAEDERSFETLISLRLDPKDPRPRVPAREEDPHLFEFGKKYFEPWLHTVVEAKMTALATPLQVRIAALEAESEGLTQQRLRELHEAAAREETRVTEQLDRVNELEGAMEAGRQREATLEQHLANADQQKAQLQARVAQQQDQLAAQRDQLAAAAAVEQELRGELAASQRREQGLASQLAAEREQARLAAQQAAEREAALQEQARVAAQQAAEREAALQRHSAALQQQVEQQAAALAAAAGREAQLRDVVAAAQQRLAAAQQREDALRQRGAAMEKVVNEARAREDALREQITKMNEYMKGTQQREGRYRAEIEALQGAAKDGAAERDRLAGQIFKQEREQQQAGEVENMLRSSNTQLLVAAVHQQARADAIRDSPQRQRLKAGGGAAR